MPPALLQVQNLTTHFPGSATDAVSAVTFEVHENETLGLVGESGCGKSITSLSILRVVPPPGEIAGGHVLWKGRDLLQLPERQMRAIRGNEISMIFQEPMTSLDPLFTVGSQIMEALRLHQGLRGKTARAKAVEVLAEVGINDAERRVDAYPHELSGGMRQRVMIAIAISCNPQLLIADEPTTALDVTIQAQIMDLLRREQQRRQMALLLITHNMGLVARMCRRVAVMCAGSIVELAPVEEIFASARHPYTQALLRSVPSLHSPGKQPLRTMDWRPPAGAAGPLGEVAPGHWVTAWQ